MYEGRNSPETVVTRSLIIIRPMRVVRVCAIDQRFQKKIPSSNWTEHCRGAQRMLRIRHTNRKEKKNKDGRSGREGGEGGEGWWGPSKSMVVMVVAWTVSWPQLRGSVVRAFRVTILRLPLFSPFPLSSRSFFFTFVPLSPASFYRSLHRHSLCPIIFHCLPTSPDLVSDTSSHCILVLA